jgi:hypothetical protein
MAAAAAAALSRQISIPRCSGFAAAQHGGRLAFRGHNRISTPKPRENTLAGPQNGGSEPEIRKQPRRADGGLGFSAAVPNFSERGSPPCVFSCVIKFGRVHSPFRLWPFGDRHFAGRTCRAGCISAREAVLGEALASLAPSRQADRRLVLVAHAVPLAFIIYRSPSCNLPAPNALNQFSPPSLECSGSILAGDFFFLLQCPRVGL